MLSSAAPSMGQADFADRFGFREILTASDPGRETEPVAEIGADTGPHELVRQRLERLRRLAVQEIGFDYQSVRAGSAEPIGHSEVFRQLAEFVAGFDLKTGLGLARALRAESAKLTQSSPPLLGQADSGVEPGVDRKVESSGVPSVISFIEKKARDLFRPSCDGATPLAPVGTEASSEGSARVHSTPGTTVPDPRHMVPPRWQDNGLEPNTLAGAKAAEIGTTSLKAVVGYQESRLELGASVAGFGSHEQLPKLGQQPPQADSIILELNESGKALPTFQHYTSLSPLKPGLNRPTLTGSQVTNAAGPEIAVKFPEVDAKLDATAPSQVAHENVQGTARRTRLIQTAKPNSGRAATETAHTDQSPVSSVAPRVLSNDERVEIPSITSLQSWNGQTGPASISAPVAPTIFKGKSVSLSDVGNPSIDFDDTADPRVGSIVKKSGANDTSAPKQSEAVQSSGASLVLSNDEPVKVLSIRSLPGQEKQTEPASIPAPAKPTIDVGKLLFAVDVGNQPIDFDDRAEPRTGSIMNNSSSDGLLTPKQRETAFLESSRARDSLVVNAGKETANTSDFATSIALARNSEAVIGVPHASQQSDAGIRAHTSASVENLSQVQVRTARGPTGLVSLGFSEPTSKWTEEALVPARHEIVGPVSTAEPQIRGSRLESLEMAAKTRTSEAKAAVGAVFATVQPTSQSDIDSVFLGDFLTFAEGILGADGAEHQVAPIESFRSSGTLGLTSPDVASAHPSAASQVRSDTNSKPKSRFATTIVAQLRANEPSEGRTVVELSPKGLGQVEIDVRSEAGAMKVTIRADNQTVLTALRENREHLALAIGTPPAQLDFQQHSQHQNGQHDNGFQSRGFSIDKSPSDTRTDPEQPAAIVIRAGKLDLTT